VNGPLLLRQAPAHSLKFTREVIKQAFGASVEELFDEFEEVPVASGSIGQVYKAKLTPKGARNTGIDPGETPFVLTCHRLDVVSLSIPCLLCGDHCSLMAECNTL
jgi:hypothetical protein